MDDALSLYLLKLRIMHYRLKKANKLMMEAKLRYWQERERHDVVASILKRARDNERLGLIRPEDLRGE